MKLYIRENETKRQRKSYDYNKERYLHILVGDLESELMKDTNFEVVSVDYNDKYVIFELLLNNQQDNQYIAKVPFTELHIGEFDKLKDDVQWILDTYTYWHDYELY